MKGRGASRNPANRFERLELDWEVPPPDKVPTQYLIDSSKSIISTNTSPDVGFNASLNPYRGCSHGCSYCYSRPTHEYLGFSAGLDFESKILVKPDAPALLRDALASPKWKPQPLALSGVTDPYQPVEKKLEVTRGCLEVLVESRNPVLLITKNRLITRDLDLLGRLVRFDAVSAALSIPTLDGELARVMEPRASHPRDRLRAVAELSAAGIPTSVMIAPVIPGLTDHELPAILEAAADAGAERAGYVLLKLPGAVEQIFLAWLDEHFPERRRKVLSRIRAFREGRLNQSDFAVRGRGSSALAREFADFFRIQRRRYGVERPRPDLSVENFRRPETAQRSLFD